MANCMWKDPADKSPAPACGAETGPDSKYCPEHRSYGWKLVHAAAKERPHVPSQPPE